MNEELLTADLTAVNFLCHYGVPKMEWYKNKAARWQSHAKYARGQSNPNVRKASGQHSYAKPEKIAKKERKLEKERQKQTRLGNNDAVTDFIADARLNPSYYSNYAIPKEGKKFAKPDLLYEKRFRDRRPDAMYDSKTDWLYYGNEKNKSVMVSKEYYDSYMKTYDDLAKKYGIDKMQDNKGRISENVSRFLVKDANGNSRPKTYVDYTAQKFIDEKVSTDDAKKLSRLGKDYMKAMHDENDESLSDKQRSKAYDRRYRIEDDTADTMMAYDYKYFDAVMPEKIKKALDVKHPDYSYNLTDPNHFHLYSVANENALRAYDKKHGTDLLNDYEKYLIALENAQVDKFLPELR